MSLMSFWVFVESDIMEDVLSIGCTLNFAHVFYIFIFEYNFVQMIFHKYLSSSVS